MTPKERVYAAIRRKPLDRLPRFLWVGDGAAANMQKAFGFDKKGVEEYVKNDIHQTWLSINKQMMLVLSGEDDRFVDEWGITWQRDGYYNTPIIHPFAEMTAEKMKKAPFPDPLDADRYVDLRRLINQYGGEYFIGADISGTLFEPAYHLCSMENLMMDLADSGEKADILLDRLLEFSLSVSLEAVRMGIDWIWLGDDMGTQVSMLLSPAMWRQHFKPRMQRIIQSLRTENPDIIIAYHSCGSIYPIIEDLVEIGIDVLNPLQESAIGMSQSRIKQEFGDHITLMCGLDTQSFLVKSTPEQVYKAMRDKVCIMSEGGGYIAAVSHTIQHDVPAENIRAMLNALDDAEI